MKKRSFAIGLFAVSAMLLAACESTNTTLLDPNEDTGKRSTVSVSSSEMRQVTRAAVKDAMENPKFISFLKKYKEEMNDPEALPILKLDQTVNDTNDPDLNTSEITEMIFEELINAGKVDVTLAEGSSRSGAIKRSRELEDDEDFDQSTVAKRGTLQAARLVLSPQVISNNLRDGNTTVVTRTFVMRMADIKTGTRMWQYSKQLAFKQKKSSVGW